MIRLRCNRGRYSRTITAVRTAEIKNKVEVCSVLILHINTSKQKRAACGCCHYTSNNTRQQQQWLDMSWHDHTSRFQQKQQQTEPHTLTHHTGTSKYNSLSQNFSESQHSINFSQIVMWFSILSWHPKCPNHPSLRIQFVCEHSDSLFLSKSNVHQSVAKVFAECRVKRTKSCHSHTIYATSILLGHMIYVGTADVCDQNNTTMQWLTSTHVLLDLYLNVLSTHNNHTLWILKGQYLSLSHTGIWVVQQQRVRNVSKWSVMKIDCTVIFQQICVCTPCVSVWINTQRKTTHTQHTFTLPTHWCQQTTTHTYTIDSPLPVCVRVITNI